MGQSKIGPSHPDRSFSSNKFQYDRQFTFHEPDNYELLNKALIFSNENLMIHECLYINGHFLSNCKFTVNSFYNLKDIKNLLQRENKILTFQHEFERIRKDFRFKSNIITQNTTIQEVNITELYKQANSFQHQNIQMMDSFGTNNSINQIANRGRQNQRQKKANESSSEDFTDLDDKSKSPSPINNKSQDNFKKNNVILKKNFPSDTDSGQEQKQMNKEYSRIIKDKKTQALNEATVSNPNYQFDNDQEEQELVFQVNSDLMNLKSRIEQQISPSYKNIPKSEIFTTNYQKLVEKQNNQQQKQSYQSRGMEYSGQEKQLLQQDISPSNKQNKYQQQSIILQQDKQQIQSNLDFQEQKERPKPVQLKNVTIKVNQNMQSPKNSLAYKPIVQKEFQVHLDSSNASSVYKPPWDVNQVKKQFPNQSNSSACFDDIYQQNRKQQQQQQFTPNNIKIDVKQFQQKRN
ncbi:unnamed protein product [Paramecium octaurelia]|uniref:Uncharacterized protein n=1 Tax=Paramecium octaurelia TaxID=43137 RepID=A0A8S1TQ23_PAROT|nr:unnamed protein product [Paramecium octaurelia]